MSDNLNKKEMIMQAALGAYARYGIRDATLRQVAGIAGIGKSTIFEYFRNSDELMNEAFAWYIAQASGNRAAILELAGNDPAAALSKYFDDLTALIVKEPGKLLLISQYVTAILASGTDFAGVKRKYAETLQPSADALLSEFTGIVESGIRSGAFRPVGGACAADCALMLSAFAREMQAQAFVQDEAEVISACQKLKRIAFRLLGCDTY